MGDMLPKKYFLITFCYVESNKEQNISTIPGNRVGMACSRVFPKRIGERTMR